MRSLPTAFLAVAAICLVTPIAKADRFVVDTGHIGAVRAMAISGDGDRLVTVGDDGSVREFDIDTGRLVRMLQASPFRLIDLAVHPTKPRVAVVESDSVSLFYLSVWDMERKERLYSIRLGEKPISIGFSPGGTYLVYTRADWNSLVVLNADRGTEIRKSGVSTTPRFPGFGIVGGFFISDTERTLVTYLTSGSIQYRDMETGELKPDTTRIPTIKDISDLVFLVDGWHAIGEVSGEVVAINLVTGRKVASFAAPGIDGIAVDRRTGEVLLLLRDAAGKLSMSLLAFQSDQFIERYSLYQPPRGETISSLLLDNRTVFSAATTGTMYRQTRYQAEPTLYSRNRLADVHDILPGESTIIAAADRFLTVNFEIRIGAKPGIIVYSQPNPLSTPIDASMDPQATAVQDSTISPPLSPTSVPTDDPTVTDPLPEADSPVEPEAPTSYIRLDDTSRMTLRAVSDGRHLLFDRDGSSGLIAYFDPVSGSIEPIPPFIEPPIASLVVRGFDTLSLDSSGTLRITNLFSQTDSYLSNIPGLRTAVFGDEPFIIAAGRRGAVTRSTVLRIDTDTFETVPISTQSSITYSIAYDSNDGSLYAVGIVGTSSPPRTVFTRHWGSNLERSETIYSIDGEFFDASVAAENGVVFASIGGVNLLKRRGSRTFAELQGRAIPESVAVDGDYLYARNRDSSITLWQAKTGTLLADFYTLENDAWAAISSDDTLLASSRNAASLIRRYE
jgi:WD40 repeat protein